MVKSELISQLTQKFYHLTDRDIGDAVSGLLELITNSLANNQRVEIRGFGSFSLHYRAPRQAHNPRTGQRLITKAKYSPHFKAGKDLRERVNASRHSAIQIEADPREF